MPMKLLLLIHVLASTVWVGGMFFAHMCLRPVALTLLEPPQRLRLWHGVFGRFFPWVWTAVILLIVSGKLAAGQMGDGAAPMYVHVMAGIGYLMATIFAYIYFVPYRAIKAAVAAGDWPAAGAALNKIRPLVATNLTLGLSNIGLIFLLPLLA